MKHLLKNFMRMTAFLSLGSLMRSKKITTRTCFLCLFDLIFEYIILLTYLKLLGTGDWCDNVTNKYLLGITPIVIYLIGSNFQRHTIMLTTSVF